MKRICSLIRAHEVQRIAADLHERERRDKSYKAIWRTVIHPRYGISYRTFLRYLHADLALLKNRPEDE